MISVVVLSVLVVTCLGGDYSYPKHGYTGHGVFGGGNAGFDGIGIGGVGGFGGDRGIGGFGNIGGGVGGFPVGLEKYGTCPPFNGFDQLQYGPYCTHDEQCHGVHKCCWSVIHGHNRCQIPREYQNQGTCSTNYIFIGSQRLACNDDTTCHGYKCCKRLSSGQVDTCAYPPFRTGGDVSGWPSPSHIYRPPHNFSPRYPRHSKVY